MVIACRTQINSNIMHGLQKFQRIFLFFSFVIYCSFSCTPKSDSPPESVQIQKELSIIDSLLRDSAFALSMATSLDSAYYAGIGEASPGFLTPEEDTAVVIKQVKDEKIATNLAGFYALECGIGLLCTQSEQTPVEWLQKIKNGTADSNAVLLLNRFANATWKAGQPFRGLSRITRYNFTIASLLSEDEVKKDYYQVTNAASKLLASMDTARNKSLPQQMQNIRALVQDTIYAMQMASYMDSSYAISQKQKPAPFLTSSDDSATITKTVKEMKIATNIAGFYAVECGVNYLTTTKHVMPSKILQSLVDDSISKDDKMIFARFANATWKAGQPFRGLNRISRATFTPFYFLNESDIEKDLVQVKMAAARILSILREDSAR